jgi:hypothetical protein
MGLNLNNGKGEGLGALYVIFVWQTSVEAG